MAMIGREERTTRVEDRSYRKIMAGLETEQKVLSNISNERSQKRLPRSGVSQCIYPDGAEATGTLDLYKDHITYLIIFTNLRICCFIYT